jgi:DNA-binding PadR family transcriptional regulator
MPPNSIMSAIDQLAGSGYITLVVDEGVVYRITPAGLNEVENNPPGHDRRGVFALGSSPQSITSPPIIDSTPDEFSSVSSVGERAIDRYPEVRRHGVLGSSAQGSSLACLGDRPIGV